jgi:hypothetical protein
MKTAVAQMTWDALINTIGDCKTPSQVGWRIARWLRVSPYKVWQNALDVKYGLHVISLMKKAIDMRKRPQWVFFDKKGNVEAQW